jgi:hypothetical protein
MSLHLQREDDPASPDQAQEVLDELDRILGIVVGDGGFKTQKSGGTIFDRFLDPEIVITDEAWMLHGRIRRTNSDGSISETSVEKPAGAEWPPVLREVLLMPKVVPLALSGADCKASSLVAATEQDLRQQEREKGLDRAFEGEAEDLLIWLRAVEPVS